MTDRRNGFSNKDLIIRVLDEISEMHTKLDAKADRSELRAFASSIQAESLSAKESAAQAISEVRTVVRAKVGRAELFGWFSFVGAVVGIIVGIIL